VFAGGACLHWHGVLASTAKAICKVSGHTSTLAYRAYPFASAAVAALFGSNPKGRCDLARCTSPNKPYSARLHLLFAIANTKAAKDTVFVLYLKADLVDAEI